jgi:hypothetical protein
MADSAAGGNWANGRELFFSEQLACGKCHKIGETGETADQTRMARITTDCFKGVPDRNPNSRQ